ncbi:MAG: hypothetical protein KF708_17475 [Pirellulales bacterium]|nr:hypothetical protein [Pirellulales bacterium]
MLGRSFGVGHSRVASGHRSRRRSRIPHDTMTPAFEPLEARQLLAVDVLQLGPDGPRLELAVEDDPLREGAVNITIHRTDSLKVPLRLELKNTPQGLGLRTDTTLPFNADLDQQTAGLQAYGQISTITFVGGVGDDTLLLDESALALARAFQIDGGGGHDRLEHRRDVSSGQGSNLIDLNLGAGRIEFISDSSSIARQVRTAQFSGFEDVAFYSSVSSGTLVVRTGSGHADRVTWQPGRFDVQLGPVPESAPQTRITYTELKDVWLMTAGGADTVTLNDLGFAHHSENVRRGLVRGHLHVATQDESDTIVWNLLGDRSQGNISLHAGDGAQNRLEVRSFRGQSEEYFLEPGSFGYRDRFRQAGGVAGAGGSLGILTTDPWIIAEIYGGKQLHQYHDFQQLYLATGGGDDTIVVDERVAAQPLLNFNSQPGHLPRDVTIDAQDDNDAIEVNVVAKYPASRYQIDGGAGTNGLTQFVRRPRIDLSQTQDENFMSSVFVSLRGNEIGTDYFSWDRRTTGPPAIPSDDSTRDATTLFQQITGVTIVTLEQGNIELDAASTPATTKNIQWLVRSDYVMARLSLGGNAMDKAVRVDATGHAPMWLIVTSQNGDETVRVIDNVATFLNSAANKSSLEFINIGQLEIETGQGDDHVIVEQSAKGEFPGGLLLSTGSGDDSIDYILTQPTALRTKLAVHGGPGAQDIFTFRDAPGNNLDIRVDTGFYSPSIDIAADEVEYLRFFGGDGDDQFQNGTGIPSLLDGGAGNDTLFGGFAADVLYGGDGIDQLWGRDGRDAFYPDYNATGLLFALSGDFVYGGKGDDLIITRAIDQIVDEDGVNQIQDFVPLGAFDGTGGTLADCMCLLDHGLALDSQGRIASSMRGVMSGVTTITAAQPDAITIPTLTYTPSVDSSNSKTDLEPSG